MENVILDDQSDFNEIVANYNPLNNTSKNIMTKYEKTSIVGVRMEQLAYGAPSTLSVEELKKYKNIKDIANEELHQKKIPFMLLRTLPNKSQEYWRISDMIIPHY
jgi:DNA-directed RNA polymerase subunit K/omega